MKKTIVEFSKKIGLLSLLEPLRSMKGVYSSVKNYPRNRKFIRENPTFVKPPVGLAYDAYNHTNWEEFHTSGLQTAKLFSDFILKYIPKKEIEILDWGCGMGRIFRHLPTTLNAYNFRVCASDYNTKTIDWCKLNYKNINFQNNQLEPPLNFSSSQFDVIYSFSVFTHLSFEMHEAWLKELKRVLKNDGILIFTTHGDFFRNRLSEQQKLQYDSNQMVVLENAIEGKRCYSTFHPPALMRNVLLKDFVILDHYAQEGFQDVWVVKR